jgi:hypothetical protein
VRERKFPHSKHKGSAVTSTTSIGMECLPLTGVVTGRVSVTTTTSGRTLEADLVLGSVPQGEVRVHGDAGFYRQIAAAAATCANWLDGASQ